MHNTEQIFTSWWLFLVTCMLKGPSNKWLCLLRVGVLVSAFPTAPKWNLNSLQCDEEVTWSRSKSLKVLWSKFRELFLLHKKVLEGYSSVVFSFPYHDPSLTFYPNVSFGLIWLYGSWFSYHTCPFIELLCYRIGFQDWKCPIRVFSVVCL